MNVWLEIVGWTGSGILVLSLLQTRILRLRFINLIGCLILIGYNTLIQVWPMVGLNVVLATVNIVYLAKMLRSRHDADAYEVLEVDADDSYLRHVLRVHEGDIRAFNPEFVHDPFSDDEAFLVLRGDETVGVVLVHDAGGGTAQVVLDYVTPRYRDFSPGEFVYDRSGLFRSRGFTRVVTPPGMVEPYYDRLGFRAVGESFVLDLR